MKLFAQRRTLAGTVLGGPTGRGFTVRTAPWELLNITSLDAPLVAVVWLSLVGRTFGAALSWPHGALLGLTVWLIYSADRWLDGLVLGTRARTARHRFYVRHRRAVLWVWLGVAVGTVVGSVAALTQRELFVAALLGVLLLGYFASRHVLDLKAHPKEVQIAVVFALGVSFLPGLNGAPLPPLAAFTVLFAALVFLNCALIARWEGELDVEPVPFAARTPGVAARLGRGALGLACCGFGAGLVAYPPLFFAVGGSALLLYGGGYLGAHLSPAARRVGADAALLTPLLALLFTHG